MQDNRTILHGDVLEKLKDIESESIDLIATDPPYGYSFMNKDWDKAVIGVNVWKECLRVLKPGSWAFVMSAPRQDVLSHMIVNLSNAGFKTDFTSIYWAYASGFPKAMNISKAVDKKLGTFEDREGTGEIKTAGYIRKGRTDEEIFLSQKTISSAQEVTKPASPQAKALDGSYAGYQPKPAVEVILVAMKPLSEKNYVEQAMKNTKGVTWLDDVRIPYQPNDKTGFRPNLYGNDYESISNKYGGYGSKISEQNPQGRFPANLLVSDDSLDTGKKTKSSGGMGDKSIKSSTSLYSGYDSRDNNSLGGFGDSGDFSRYYSLDAWEAQFIVTPKPSKSEKNKGLKKYMYKTDVYEGKYPNSGIIGEKVNDGRETEMDTPYQRGETIRQNVHPTVKPVSLFKYLITMGSRPNDIVLDPFMGSGTTAIACEKTARNWMGIELNEDYIKIAKKRLDLYKNNKLELFL